MSERTATPMKSEEFEVLRYLYNTEAQDGRVNISQILHDLNAGTYDDPVSHHTYIVNNLKMHSIIVRLKKLNYILYFHPTSQNIAALEHSIAASILDGDLYISTYDLCYFITGKGRRAFEKAARLHGDSLIQKKFSNGCIEADSNCEKENILTSLFWRAVTRIAVDCNTLLFKRK